LALDGLQLEYAPTPMGNFASKTLFGYSRLSVAKSRRLAGKSRPLRFFLLRVTNFQKKTLIPAKTQFKGIPTTFPILARKIQITMPRPNALHGPQPKIKDIGN